MKHLLRLLILSVFVLSGSFHSLASSDVTIDGIGYSYNRWNYSMEVNECAKDVKIARILPEVEYNGRKYPVTNISSGFRHLPNLEEIYIPSSIKKISQLAFDGLDNLKKSEFESLESLCSIHFESSPMLYSHNVFINGEEITEVTIPSTVTTLYSCFEGVTNLRYVKIPDSVTDILFGAFWGCTGLEEIEIGESVEYIGWHAFDGCTSLKHVSIPASTTTIGDYIFAGCSNLESVDLSPHLTEIGSYSFNGCTKLSHLDLSGSVTTIKEYAFYGCTSLETLILPESLSTIGREAFMNCESLRSIVLPDPVTKIGENAFMNCKSLSSVTLPQTLTEIDNAVFKGCSGLISISFPSSIKSIGAEAFSECISLKELRLPENITTISKGAFADCSNLESLIIEDSYTPLEFEDNKLQAFYGTNLQTLYLGRTIKYQSIPTPQSFYNTSPFRGLESIKSVTLGNRMIYIVNDLLADCPGLTEVSVPGNVTTIYPNAFQGCTGLKKLVFEDSDVPLFLCCNEAHLFYYGLFDDCPLETLYSGRNFSFSYDFVGKYNNIADPFQRSPLKSVVFGDRVKTIKSLSFSECSRLKDIVFGTSLTTIEQDAFFGCFYSFDRTDIPSLEVTFNSLTPPDTNGEFDKKGSVEQTGIYWVPAESLDLYRNTFPYLDHVLPIGGISAFDITVTTPGTLLEMIPDQDVLSVIDLKISGKINGTDIITLNQMTNLQTLDLSEADIVSGGEAYWESDWRSYRTSDNELGTYWGHNLSWLTDLKLPKSITKINYEAFYGFRYLRNIEIYDGVTEIGYKAFSNLVNLKSITLPETVTTMGTDVFYGCEALTTVKLPESLTEISESLFSGCSSLSEVAIPGKVSTIGVYAFADCTSLTDISLPEGLKSIGESAFENCTSIKTVELPYTLEELGNYAFEKCSSLEAVTFVDTDSGRSSLLRLNYHIFNVCPNLSSLNIPASVKYIDEMFGSYNPIKQLVFPGGLRTLHIRSIPEEAYFLGPIPPTIKVIPDYDNPQFATSSIHVPKGSLTEYKHDDNWNEFKTMNTWNCGSEIRKEIDGVTYHVTSSTCKTAEVCAINGSVHDSSLVIPETVNIDGEGYTVMGIANGAVQGCSLTAVTFNPSCGYIGFNAFAGCPDISEINCEKPAPCPTVRVTSFDPRVVENAKVMVCEENCLRYIEDPEWKYFLMNYIPEKEIKGVYFDKSELTLKVGETFNLTISGFYPAGLPAYPPAFLITCSDPEVVSVDRWCKNDRSHFELEGKVLKEGSCVLTAGTIDGSDAVAKCVIRVPEADVKEINSESIDTDAEVDIFNLQGIMVFKGMYQDAALDKGTYLVRQGAKTRKIHIKSDVN